MTLSEHLTFLTLQDKLQKELVGTRQYLGGPEIQIFNYTFTNNGNKITIRANEDQGEITFVYANVLNTYNTTKLVSKEKEIMAIINGKSK